MLSTIPRIAKVLFELGDWDGVVRRDCRTSFGAYGSSTSNPTCCCNMSYQSCGCRMGKPINCIGYNGCQSSCEQGFLAICLRYYVFLAFHTEYILRYRIRSCFTTILGLGVIMYCNSSHFKVMSHVASKMVLHDAIEMSPYQDDKPNPDRPSDPQREAELLQALKDTAQNLEHGLILYGNLNLVGLVPRLTSNGSNNSWRSSSFKLPLAMSFSLDMA